MLLWLKRQCPLFLKNHLKYFLFLRYKIKETLSLSKRVYYCPCCGIKLQRKKVTPHTLRHTTAMNLLQAGIDISTIAIWLGHESIETTHKYMVADIELKRKAMEKLTEAKNATFRYKPSNSILDFLRAL